MERASRRTASLCKKVNMDNFSRAVESVNPVFLSKKAAGSKEADQDNDAQLHTGDAEEDIASEFAEPWAIRRQASGGANAVMRASSTGSVRSSSDLELKVRAIIHISQPDVT